MSKPIIWVGLDVHKDSITAAMLEGDSNEPEVLRISSDLQRVRRLFRRLGTRGPVRACYEASSCGYVLQRDLERCGFTCQVIAPSLIPKKPGERCKTDRIDAVMLARLYRSGHLTAIQIPTKEQESLRCLLRLRYRYQELAKDTKRRILSTLLSEGLVFRETKTPWSLKHRRWLEKQRRELSGPLGTILSTELENLEYLEMQRTALDAEIERHAQMPSYSHLVKALCCLRGVKTLTAMVLISEIGDIRRFDSPRALMAWTGLVPMERNRETRGGITKTGNAHVRRILIEAGWHNRHRSRAGQHLERRREGMPTEILAIAVKAQHRLCKRFLRLSYRKNTRVAVAAVARELCGFVWAMMKVAPQTA